MSRGVWGPLESTVPPITVPAWMAMMTGCDPGTLGIYGFRNRKDHSYDGLTFANSRMVRQETVWDVLARAGKRSILLGVPLTYPPRPINGLMVCDFLAPGTDVEYTYPAALADEIKQAVGEYIIDVRQFRTDDKDRLLADIHRMTETRFRLARHLVTHHEWDFFMMVEMGPDRMHHGFWRFFDEGHPDFHAGNPLQNAMRDYYRALDARIGELLAVLPEDTLVLVVSDHGAKRMVGGICFNDWLIENGYLALKSKPAGATKFRTDMVDWLRTKAWGDGGYYGRLFLNVKGREPEGTIEPGDYESVRDELVSRLQALPDENGRPIGTRVYRPEQVYREVNNVSPDLIVYFGDLDWRSVGSVGNGSVWTHANDTGPDDANHAQHGIAIAAGPGFETAGGVRQGGMRIYDIAPTILRALGVEPSAAMSSAGIAVPAADSVYSEEEEAEIARRLEDLGYL